MGAIVIDVRLDQAFNSTDRLGLFVQFFGDFVRPAIADWLRTSSRHYRCESGNRCWNSRDNSDDYMFGAGYGGRTVSD